MMLRFNRFAFLLTLLSTFFSIISAVPSLSVIRGYSKNIQTSLQRYSGIVEFKDKSVPGDKSKMSDGQFINMAKVAYGEMVAIWSEAKIGSDL
jgi:hypothetical protein